MRKLNLIKKIQLIVLIGGIITISQAQKISTKHFEGYEKWPIYVPGDLKLDNEKLTDLRVEYLANEMGGPGGPNLKLYMDVMDVMFKGKHADWIQWTFTDTKIGTKGTPNLDLLIVDRDTYKLLFRLHPNPSQSGPNDPNKWAGPYGFIQVMPTKIRQFTVTNNGKTSLDTLALNTPIYEFATLGFMFPFMELEQGKKFQLKRHNFGSKTTPILAVQIIGKTKITDGHGKKHEVWRIDSMGTSKSAIVTYYVSKKAPYFYGWDYKRVEDGFSIFKMTYMGWKSTTIKK